MKNPIKIINNVISEIKQVVWPTRYDVIRYTVTIVVFSLVLATVLGAADYGLLKGFEALIK
ncbi:MAG: preprotein translocase subunit SecE [Candidatus Doudnabacteria bacterium]